VVDELSHGRLRCRWGATPPAVDGRWHAPSGGEPERLVGQHMGSLGPETTPVGEDRHVGGGLRQMAAGDVVFLPHSPDDGHFMVAMVQRPLPVLTRPAWTRRMGATRVARPSSASMKTIPRMAGWRCFCDVGAGSGAAASHGGLNE
jgi:hypothetical protein